MGFDKAKKENH